MKVMTTRSRPRSSTVSYSSNPRRTREVYARLQARLPRRMSDEDARERYRREKFGQLGPVDAWLLARLSQNRTQSQNQGQSQSLTLESQSASASILPRLGPRQGGEASADEVRCTVQVECIEAPSDGSGFDDPDKYILYLTTTTAGAARRLGAEGNDAPSTSKFNLGEFVGEPENVEAPEWMRQYHTGQPKEFWASAAAVADVLQHTAPWEGVLVVSNFVHILTFDGRVLAPGATGGGIVNGRELTYFASVFFMGTTIAFAGVAGCGEPR